MYNFELQIALIRTSRFEPVTPRLMLLPIRYSGVISQALADIHGEKNFV